MSPSLSMSPFGKQAVMPCVDGSSNGVSEKLKRWTPFWMGFNTSQKDTSRFRGVPQVEFRYISQITGDQRWQEAADKAGFKDPRWQATRLSQP